MEPTTGIEPVNLILTKDALYQLSYVGSNGAGNGTRTRNPQLGRLTLWPLSYSRRSYRDHWTVAVARKTFAPENMHPALLTLNLEL